MSSFQQAVRRGVAALFGSVFTLAACAASLPPGVIPTPLVVTQSGPVVGMQFGSISQFLAIPYAAPPLGALRWRPPQAPAAWTAPRQAYEYGELCPQDLSTVIGARPPVGEDCLTLNIWTPSQHAKPLPVIVWLHGGGYFQGSASQWPTNGMGLAKRGAVVVTANFRLGALGFLAHPMLDAEGRDAAHPLGHSGNYGILDQIAVLHWVHANIAAFGGDPGNVTLLGQSSGAVTVSVLMSTPLAAGLFHKAILLSGAAPDALRDSQRDQLHGALPDDYSLDTLGVRFARAMGIPGGHPLTLGVLRAAPWQQIVYAWKRTLGALAGDGTYFHLGIDHALLNDAPGVVFRRGQQARIPLLIGTDADEGTWFARHAQLTNAANLRNYLDKVYGEPAASAIDALYAPRQPRSEVDWYRAGSALIGDQVRLNLRNTADAMSAIEPAVYVYEFRRDGPRPGRFAYLGDYHSAELPYLFDLLPPELPPRDRLIADDIASRFVAFARSGAPDLAGKPAWPRYRANQRRIHVIGGASAPAHALDAPILDALARAQGASPSR
jgi:para-nitrobenzyl esterase